MDQSDIDDAPKVVLGKKEWPIPELGARRIIKITNIAAKIGRVELSALTDETLDRVYDIAYIAMTQAEPGLKREDFDEMPIKPGQILTALPTILRQAGLEWKSGETGKPAAESLSTGTG